MEPLYPPRTDALEDLARELIAASAKLEGRLAPATLEGIRKLLRVVNSYYSNLIEGHSTHPVDIERAMREDYSADQEKRERLRWVKSESGERRSCVYSSTATA